MKFPGTVLRTVIWFTALSVFWIDVLHSEIEAALGDRLAEGARWGAAFATHASRVGLQGVEAGFYVLVGRALGRPVRFAPLFLGIFSLSMLDALSLALGRLHGTETPPLWSALLTGFRALPAAADAPSGLRVAFGSVGLLVLARVAGTALILSRQGVRMRTAVAVTTGAWLASRVATWWTADLARGVSPLP